MKYASHVCKFCTSCVETSHVETSHGLNTVNFGGVVLLLSCSKNGQKSCGNLKAKRFNQFFNHFYTRNAILIQNLPNIWWTTFEPMSPISHTIKLENTVKGQSKTNVAMHCLSFMITKKWLQGIWRGELNILYVPSLCRVKNMPLRRLLGTNMATNISKWCINYGFATACLNIF